MFKLVGGYLKAGKVIIFGQIKESDWAVFAESGFNNLLDCETIYVDSISTVFEKAPNDSNFCAIVGSDGVVIAKYFVAAGVNHG